MARVAEERKGRGKVCIFWRGTILEFGFAKGGWVFTSPFFPSPGGCASFRFEVGFFWGGEEDSVERRGDLYLPPPPPFGCYWLHIRRRCGQGGGGKRQRPTGWEGFFFSAVGIISERDAFGSYLENKK